MIQNAGSMTVHWHVEDDSHGIRWLLLDKANSKANVLSQPVLLELADLIDPIAANPPVGVVIKSAKQTGFAAGADISEFRGLHSAEQVETLAGRAHALMSRLEDLPCPTVAAMHGFALGGGLELALACDYRIAAESHERCMGLPEVKLGIHPGFGGTVRSVRLLGPPVALDLMLTGRSISPREARRVGLVDRIVPAADIDRAAREIIGSRPPIRRAPVYLRILNLAPVRRWLGRRIRARVERRARREHYPSPAAIVDLWVRHGVAGPSAYRAEARSIGNLLVTPASRNLVRVFFLRERLRGTAPKSHDVRRVHVAGTGIMGGDIAAWCAIRGFRVTVHDRSDAQVESALTRAATLFERRLKAPGAAAAAKRRLRADAGGSAEADLVIEAIVERPDAKRALFRDLERRMRADALLATNTSSISLERLSRGLKHRERFLGLHFFNPVAKLPLVEVVRGSATDPSILDRAISFVTAIGKLPLPCADTPGFLVNRILAPYFAEALVAHRDGYAPETIDTAAEDFGMPMGPVELADRVGLDVALKAAATLGEPLGDAISLLEDKVRAGELGAKSGIGFYRFEGNRPRKSRDFAAPDGDLQDRLILQLVNAAVACYVEGVVDDPDLVDAGVIFGTGFAPFTGGPIQYARQRGIEATIQRLESLAATLGPRFTPHPGWQRLL